MNQIKPQRHQQPSSGVFHVQFRPQRRRQVPDHSLGNAIDSNRVSAQHVLCQPNRRPGEQPGNRIPSRHGKKNRHQQRQVKDGKEWKPSRHKSLQEQRQQRYADRHRNAEPVNLNLFPRCVSDGHASGDYLRLPLLAEWNPQPGVLALPRPVSPENSPDSSQPASRNSQWP